jgi:hypothetical protein
MSVMGTGVTEGGFVKLAVHSGVGDVHRRNEEDVARASLDGEAADVQRLRVDGAVHRV